MGGVAERFFLALSEITHVEGRIRCLVSTQTLVEKMKNIQAHLIIVDEACQQIHNSSRLQHLLTIILAFGNRMNSGRNVSCFRLSTLDKLANTKGHDRKTSLLH